MQGYSRYAISKVQSKIEQFNVGQGLFRAWNRAQGKLNSIEDKVWNDNNKFMIKWAQDSGYDKLLAGGAQGKSIKRFGIVEAGAAGRYFAANMSALTDAREKFKAGMKYDRMVASQKQEQAYAKVAFAPTPDIAAAAPAMQSVGAAFFGDVMGFVGSVVGIGAGLQTWSQSDSRLKEDVKKIGTSIDGHNIYKFKYLDSPEYYTGVMAEEVYKKKPEAVGYLHTGYLGVDYDQIDVEMRRVADGNGE